MAIVIQSGFAKGLTLATPEGLTTRPTGAKVRAAIANMLEPYAAGGLVADICAGSGAIGLELVSRGAKAAFFFEKDRTAYRCLTKNIEQLRERAVKNRLPAPPLKSFALDARKDLSAAFAGDRFHCFWADPPYAIAVELARHLLHVLPNFAAPEAVLAIESDLADLDKMAGLLDVAPHWSLLKQKHYGQTGVSVFSLESPKAKSSDVNQEGTADER